MKTRYLLTAMALPLLFSCTQDELTVKENGNGENVALQNRVKVGKVAFTDGENTADTRFDFRSGLWEEGDMFRLFLMDDWSGNNCGWGNQWDGEDKNANATDFMEQITWNEMYSLSNRVSTNIPFTYNSGNKQWENDDAIVEGNYFAVAPAKADGQQRKLLDGIRNRRDVWVYINPVQKFDNIVKNESYMTDGVDENQFFLGYTQVYRNEKMVSDENVLQLPIQMRPILANIDLRIYNTDEIPFRAEKLVIRRLDGQAMPTLAYVRPCNNTPVEFGMRDDDGQKYYTTQWTKMATDANIDAFEKRYDLTLEDPTWQTEKWYWDWGPAFAQPYIVENTVDACGNKEANYYWTIASWTRTAARSVVKYAYPGEKGFTPYGCTGDIATPAYEYVIDFTDEDGNGVVLNNGEWIRPFIALPHNMYMREYTFTLYGQQWNKIDKVWEEGIIVPKAADYDNGAIEIFESDGSFALPDLDLSQETDYIKATIMFDDYRPVESRVVTTTNSDDLLNHLQSYFGKQGESGFGSQTKNEIFYVTTLGDFEVSNDLVNYVQALYNAYNATVGSKALVYFTESKNGKVIFPANLTNDHAIDLFYFSKRVNIVNKGVQIIEKPIIYDYNKSAEELSKAYNSSSKWWGMFNDGIDLFDKLEPFVADLLFGGVSSITNEGTLTLNKVVVETSEGANGIDNVEGATLNLVNSVVVAGYRATGYVTVHNAGTMNMEASAIEGTLNNSGKVNVKKGDLSEVTIKVNNWNECVGCPTGAAVITIEEGAEFWCPSVTNGKEDYEGEIVVEDNAKAYLSGTNNDRIVVYGQLVPYDENGSEYNLINKITGVIEVRDGELKMMSGTVNGEDFESKLITNDGMIYVIGKSHVMVDGGSGIIDVTLADKEGGYQASSNGLDTYFRYCGSVTDATLKKVISENNFGKNYVILQFPAINDNLEPEAGKSYTQGSLAGAGVKKILVTEDATLTLEGTWWLVNAKDNTLGSMYNALEVGPDANLQVLNGKELTINTETNGADVKVVIDGKMRAENGSKLSVENSGIKYEVIVNGKGTFEFAGDAKNNEWTQGDIAEWTTTTDLN